MRPITKIEARTLEAEAVTRRVAVQLAQVLRLTPREPTTVRPQRVLEDLWFWTTPRATAIPGLCQADEVVMWFAPGSVDTFDADTPTRVRGIEARPHFHFLAPPKRIVWAEWTPAEAKEADAKCAQLDPNNGSFFEARDEEDANRNALLLSRVLTQVKAGTPAFGVKCDQEPCATLLMDLELKDLLSVARCSRNDDVSNNVCSQFRIKALQVDVIWAYDDNPTTIREVNVAELVILGHTRPD